MRPHWGNGGVESALLPAHKDHIVVEYNSHWMTDSKVRTLCNRTLPRESSATGDRCQQCVVCLETLLK